MPLYRYECARHGEFSDWASLQDFDRPTRCPHCGRLAQRTISAAYVGMNSDLRRALHSSEKSADEPRVVRRRRGDPIPKHDAHTDLSKLRGNVHAHSQHRGHSHGGDHKAKTVQSKHPWLVRH